MPSGRRRRTAAVLCAVSVSSALLLSGCGTGATLAESDSGDAAATRTVEHARGATAVPENPQRVVALEPLELDTAVAVGIVPVGAAIASNISGAPAYLNVDGVEAVGSVPEPELEAIAALEPDLILGTESRHSALYTQLSAIAPTVFIATQADPWRDNALLIGEALGRENDVAELLSSVDTRCDALSAEYGVDGETAQLIRPRDETTLSLYGPVSFAGSLLECAGFTLPEQDWADGLQADLSPENVLSGRADHVFITAVDTAETSAVPEVIARNGAAFPSVTLVDTSYWVSGVGPQGAHAVLDDIETFLAENR